MARAARSRRLRGAAPGGATAFAVLILVVVSQIGELTEATVNYAVESGPLHRYPAPSSALLEFLDLTFGLALVALSEEALGRVYFRAVVSRYVSSPVVLTVLSALAFAAAHWSQGPGGLAATFLFGLIALAIYLRMRSIWPCLLGHYVANLLIFW